MNQPSSENIHWCKIYCSSDMYHKLSIRQYKQKFLLKYKWKIVMIRTGGFPEKPVFREKKQTTKKPKSLWLLGSVELIPNWYWYIGIDIPFPLIPSLFSQAKQDFASFAQCGLANAVVASDSHIACPTLFLAFLSRWRWDEDMIFQKDMIFTLSDDLDESCEEQSSLAPHQSCHLDEKYENFKKKNEILFFVQARYCAKCQF